MIATKLRNKEEIEAEAQSSVQQLFKEYIVDDILDAIENEYQKVDELLNHLNDVEHKVDLLPGSSRITGIVDKSTKEIRDEIQEKIESKHKSAQQYTRDSLMNLAKSISDLNEKTKQVLIQTIGDSDKATFSKIEEVEEKVNCIIENIGKNRNDTMESLETISEQNRNTQSTNERIINACDNVSSQLLAESDGIKTVVSSALKENESMLNSEIIQNREEFSKGLNEHHDAAMEKCQIIITSIDELIQSIDAKEELFKMYITDHENRMNQNLNKLKTMLIAVIGLGAINSIAIIALLLLGIA